jgi:hypothetical protein
METCFVKSKREPNIAINVTESPTVDEHVKECHRQTGRLSSLLCLHVRPRDECEMQQL